MARIMRSINISAAMLVLLFLTACNRGSSELSTERASQVLPPPTSTRLSNLAGLSIAIEDDFNTAKEIGRAHSLAILLGRAVEARPRYFNWAGFQHSDGQSGPTSAYASQLLPKESQASGNRPLNCWQGECRFHASAPSSTIGHHNGVCCRQAPIDYDGAHLFVGVGQSREIMSSMVEAGTSRSVQHGNRRHTRGKPTDLDWSPWGDGDLSDDFPVDPSPPGDDLDEAPTPPIIPETQPHAIGLSQLPLDNPDAADLLDEWGHRTLARILAYRPFANPSMDDDSERLSAILDTARGPDGSPPIPDLQEGDEIAVLGTRRGITYGRWIAGAADTLSMSFDFSHAGPEFQQRAGFLPLLERAGKAWTNSIGDTWEPWEFEPGRVKVQIANWYVPETRLSVKPEVEISTGLEIHVTIDDLPENVAGRGGPVNRWPTDRWEPHFGSLKLDNEFFHNAAEHRLLSTIVHEIGHVLGSWYGGSYTAPFAPYSDMLTGHWTGPNVLALHGGPAPFQDDDAPFDSYNGQRNPAATRYDFHHSGVCASIMSYCRYSTSAAAVLPAPIDFAFLADLGLSIRPETDRPESYGLAGWMHRSVFAFSVSRDLQLDLAYPARNGGHRVHGNPALDITDLLHAEASAFGHRSAGELLVSYPATQGFGLVRYAGGLIGAAISLPALPPVTGDAAFSLDLDTLDGDASFTSLTVYSGGEPASFAGGVLHYPIQIDESNAIAATGTDVTLSAAFFGSAHEEIAGTLHDPGEGLMASFGATHDKRPTAERILAGADHLTGVTTAPEPADSSQDSWSQYRCTDASSCGRRQAVAGDWSDWAPLTREQAVSATAPDPNGPAGRPHRDLGNLRLSRVLAPQDGDELQLPIDAAYLGTLTHGAFGVGVDPLSTVWTGAFGNLSGSVPEGPAQWTGLMLGYSHAEDHDQSPFFRGRATFDLDLANMELTLAFSDVATDDDLLSLPDFYFQEIALASDGTFHSDNQGIVAGALLGPDREDAAGSFRHDEADVTGSFGAYAVPDTTSLEDAGDLTISTGTNETGTYDFHSYEDWGISAKQFARQLFRAVIQQETTVDGSTTTYYEPETAVFGTPSGTNPVSGSAVWDGEARAFRRQDWSRTPATADARIEVDFAATTVDVDITDFDTDHPDLSWRDIRLFAGSFSYAAFDPNVEGSFYGTVHQGVAGTFRSDRLQGIFGAVRNDTGSFADLPGPDTVKLLPTGKVDRDSTYFHSYEDWGIWMEQFDRQLFRAVIQQRTTVDGSITTYYGPETAVFGTPSGTNPVSGSAVWDGEARAFRSDTWTPVTAEARIEVDFAAATVDVDITNFDTHHHHPDLSWQDMTLSAGSFTDDKFNPTNKGSFYGAAHQGAAGTFRSDRLQGVFGAVRNGGQ